MSSAVVPADVPAGREVPFGSAGPGGHGPHPGPDHPGMLPASLLGSPAGEAPGGGGEYRPDVPHRLHVPGVPGTLGVRRVHRTGRDWAVDVTACVLALAGGMVTLWLTLENTPARPSDTAIFIDHLVGAASCVALWFRRRWPVGVALVLVVPTALFAATAVAAAIAVFTVAVHRHPRVLAGVTGLHLAAAAVFPVVRPGSEPYWLAMVYTLVFFSGLIAWGMFVRARRQLVWSLRERAERAEATQRLLAEQARTAERARIAREMHDVLAHRVSMMALHAGALEVRPDLGSAEVARTAGLIRSSARQALEELREVIGVLRADTRSGARTGARSGAGAGIGANTRLGAGADAWPGEVPPAPQPTLADIGRLVAESRRAGMNVELTMAVDDVESAPGSLGRDVYRIVQEALTNVSKHARGTATTVTVRGRPGDGLRVTVANMLPLGGVSAPPALPGAGMGLVGLAERVALSGGTLSHGPAPDGRFVVDAELAWAQA